ncbi:redox-sensitive transcriptional activator SoxR [Phycicoccus sp. M110.8]|uniref:redox-sensitive transcriptional activator SoxR n=1 Tax=Phycicoccus sp. M110.8 TaxID=3075433 RepID=UPI0028FD0073|nr:redox-sensitive transcriptional activator SoxR [Phycicoccus sp. M110.8]MDU0313761.1 redox-sensitive transcriptional activator SoxR [Phycicoccus sp. M110.8]
MDTHDVLTVSQVAARSGFAPSALRFYEKEGLIRAGRTPGGQRRYERSVLRRLAFIRAAGNVGLSLEEIREQLDGLPAGRTPTKSDWHRISAHWRGRLDEQVAALEALRDKLDSCIGCGCLSLKQCSISNTFDEAAGSEEAPGAAYLPRLLRRPPRVAP